jgi:Rrf2 family protein
MFSKACEYALKATLYVAQRSLNNSRAGIRDISRAINSPEAFTAKILQQLSRQKIVRSARGPSGGFEIAMEDLPTMKLSAIVRAIDGDSIYRACGLGLQKCDRNQPCPVHEQFEKIREEIRQMLENTGVMQLASNVASGQVCLKR